MYIHLSCINNKHRKDLHVIRVLICLIIATDPVEQVPEEGHNMCVNDVKIWIGEKIEP